MQNKQTLLILYEVNNNNKAFKHTVLMIAM